MQAVSASLAKPSAAAFVLDQSTVGMLKHLEASHGTRWGALAAQLALPLTVFVAATGSSQPAAASTASIATVIATGDVYGALKLVVGDDAISDSHATTAATALASPAEEGEASSSSSSSAAAGASASTSEPRSAVALPPLARALPLPAQGTLPVTVACAHAGAGGPVTLLVKASRLEQPGMTVGDLSVLVQTELEKRAGSEALRRAAEAGSTDAFLGAILSAALGRSERDSKALLSSVPLASPVVVSMTLAGAHLDPGEAVSQYIGVVDASTGAPLALAVDLDAAAAVRPHSVASIVGQALDCPAVALVAAAVECCTGDEADGNQSRSREWMTQIGLSGDASAASEPLLVLHLAARPSTTKQHALLRICVTTKGAAASRDAESSVMHTRGRQALLKHLGGGLSSCLELQLLVVLGRRAGEEEAKAAESAIQTLLATVSIALSFAGIASVCFKCQALAEDVLGVISRPSPRRLLRIPVPERIGGITEAVLVESDPLMDPRVGSSPIRLSDASLGCLALLLRSIRTPAGHRAAVCLSLTGLVAERYGLMAMLQAAAGCDVTGLELHHVASDWNRPIQADSTSAEGDVLEAEALSPSSARSLGIGVTEGQLEASSVLQHLDGLAARDVLSITACTELRGRSECADASDGADRRRLRAQQSLGSALATADGAGSDSRSEAKQRLCLTLKLADAWDIRQSEI
jgi:hypothetical protein